MNTKKTRNRIFLSLGILIFFFLTALGSLFLCRNQLLHYYADQRIEQMRLFYGLQIHYRTLSLNHFSTISASKISVVPFHRDTLISLQSAQIEVNLWKLFKKEVEIKRVQADDLHIDFIKHGDVANYDFLFRKKEKEGASSDEKKDYAQGVRQLLNLFFDVLPENGRLDHIRVTERKDQHFVVLQMPRLAIEQGRFQSTIEMEEDTLQQHWRVEGVINQQQQSFRVQLTHAAGAKIHLPYLTHRFQASVSFDTLYGSLSKEHIFSRQLDLSGNLHIKGLEIFQPALSPEVVHLQEEKLDYQVHIRPDAFELDSASCVTFNRFSFHPYVFAQKREKWHITASLHKDWFPSEKLFESLPQGLFGNLSGLKTQGQLNYHFFLDVDFAHLDQLRLESDLKRDHFRILSYGNTNLSKMSAEFLYTAYEQGRPVRTFPVGPSWEHFTPLDSIPQILQTAILQSEDGSFFQHQGFRLDAFREALIYDLRVQRFARGGSTITMQLVKNVFLNRNKNIARKLEEALIVWLIETQGLTSKHRMYEVYLNIAEWGPLVYGIQEAADFYFSKKPAQLSLEESIFLASIIPKPKHFRNSFTKEGLLRDNLRGYYHQIARRLELKGLINDTVRENILPQVELRGAARNAFVTTDTLQTSPLTAPLEQ